MYSNAMDYGLFSKYALAAKNYIRSTHKKIKLPGLNFFTLSYVTQYIYNLNDVYMYLIRFILVVFHHGN